MDESKRGSIYDRTMNDMDDDKKNSIYGLHKMQKAGKSQHIFVEFIRQLCERPDMEVLVYANTHNMQRFRKFVAVKFIESHQVPRGYLPNTVHVTARHKTIAKTYFVGCFDSEILW